MELVSGGSSEEGLITQEGIHFLGKQEVGVFIIRILELPPLLQEI